jgi:CheY-like chemotaxis protein
MDGLADPVLVVDGARAVVDLNAAALRLAGGPAEWRGRPADVLFPFLHGAPIAGAAAPAELTVSTDTATYDVRVSRARAERGVWIVMLRDVSEQRRAAAEREQFVIQNSELVSRVSHELRTPVTAIRGALELVLARSDRALDGESQRLLQTALHSCERLARIVHEILDLSSIDAGRAPGTQPLTVERLLVDALLDVGHMAAVAGIRLDTSVEEGLPPVVGNHDRLVQVLVQLASNAIARGRPGQVVTLGAWLQRQVGAPRVAIDVRSSAAAAPADLEALLQGPELAVARALTEQQGGRLTVDMRGSDAAFVVHLRAASPPPAAALTRAPVRSRVAEPPPQRSSRVAEPPPGRARVLVADDDADLREVVTEALQAHGFDVIEAGDGRAATEVLERDRVDLAVLDITMPHQNGYEVIRRLRTGTYQPQVPVLVLTGTIDDRETPATLGADGLLTKPANLQRLVAEVRRLLARG